MAGSTVPRMVPQTNLARVSRRWVTRSGSGARTRSSPRTCRPRLRDPSSIQRTMNKLSSGGPEE